MLSQKILKPLNLIAKIRNGFTFREKIELLAQGDTHIIQIKDVRTVHEQENRTTLYADDFPKIHWQRREDAYLTSGSVLLPARGDYLQASCFISNTPTIASSQFLILHPNQNVLPQYLCWVLNQPFTQHQLSQRSRGSAISMLNVADVKQISIPVPEIEIQERISALYQLWQQEQRLTKDLLANRAKQLQGIYQHLLTQ